jgi:hypothetical protein
MGRSRTRLPVARWTAFAIAASASVMPTSPTPISQWRGRVGFVQVVDVDRRDVGVRRARRGWGSRYGCDTRSLNASGFTDWRFGICRRCSSGQVLMPIPTLTCAVVSWAAGCEAQGRSLSSSCSIRGLRVRGSAGRVNKSEPLLMLRHEHPRKMDAGPGYRTWPQKRGERRPVTGCRS